MPDPARPATDRQALQRVDAMRASGRSRRDGPIEIDAVGVHQDRSRLADAASALPTPDRALWPALRGTLFLLSGALVVSALYVGQTLLVPFALAVLLAFVLDPVVTALRHWRVPRPAAVVLVMVCTVVVLIGGSGFLGAQAVALSRDLPTYQSTIQDKLRTLRQHMAGRGALDDASRLLEVVNGELEATRRAIAEGEDARPEPKPLKVEVSPGEGATLQSLWDMLKPAVKPVATAALVLLFLLFILFERNDLRDRAMRLVGGDLHRTTEAMNEAAQRVSRYLTTQLAINTGYAIPLAAGLWLLGIPGALLWGVLGGLLRFIPYLGPMVAAVFPLAMAFAVDPGWDLLLYTLLLIGILEVVVINLLEPYLYGASTGLAPTAVLVSAAFWTALWGPVGLILATPLTVCLVVMGRHLPRLQFLDLMFGRDPVFDPATRLYQRLLAGDTEEAVEQALEQTRTSSPQAFYSRVGLPLLAQVAHNHNRVSGADQRHRLAHGTGLMLRELRDEHPAEAFRTGHAPAEVVCIGGRWEVDALAAEMLAHAVAGRGLTATHRPPTVVSAENIGRLDLSAARVVVLSYFSGDPAAHARYVCRRLRRHWPELRIVLGLWQAPQDLQAADAVQSLGADSAATSLDEAVARVRGCMAEAPPSARKSGEAHAPPPPAGLADGDEPAPTPAPAELAQVPFSAVAQPAAVPNDASLLHTARSNAPAQRPTGGLLDHAMRAPFEHAAQRAAECFDMPYAVVSTIDPDLQAWHLPLLRDRHKGSDHRRAAPRGSGTPGWPGAAAGEPLCQAVLDRPGVLVVPDIARDPRLRAGPALLDDGMRFLAAAPLRDARGQTLGALCLLDRQPRLLSAPEQRLLQAMADDLMQLLRSQQELVQTPGGEDDSGSHALAGVARMAARLAARGADLASAVPASLRQVTGGITVTSDRRDQPDQPNHNTHRAHRKNSTDEQGQSAAKGPTDAPEPGTQHDRPVEAEAADSAQGEGIQTASVRHPVDGDAEFHGRDTETARWHPRRLLPGSS